VSNFKHKKKIQKFIYYVNVSLIMPIIVIALVCKIFANNNNNNNNNNNFGFFQNL